MRDARSTRPSGLAAGCRWLGGVLLLGLAACQAPQTTAPATPGAGATAGQPAVADANDFLVVDCVLPAQVKRLGSRLTYLGARRALRTSGSDCAIRGGEYVAYDRGNYSTALAVWEESARNGDPQAQTYVGEIYERGLTGAPDYQKAARWYQAAADQDFGPALVNLGQLYEQGQGVPKNELTALNLYRKASGFEDAQMTLVVASDIASELDQLRGQVGAKSAEASRLRQEIGSLETELAALESARQTATGGPLIKLETWQAELEQEQAAVAAAEAQAQAQARALQEARNTIEDGRRALAKERAELEARRAQASINQAQADELQLQLTDLQRREAALDERASGFDAREAQLQLREAELAKREAALAARQNAADRSPAPAPAAVPDKRAAAEPQNLDAIDQQMAAVRERLDVTRQRLFQAFAGDDIDLAGPAISVFEPMVVPSRGLTVVPANGAAGPRPVKGSIEAPAGLQSLTINSQPAKFEARDGRYFFETKVPLAQGGTKVSIVAVDQQGKQADVNFLLRGTGDLAQAAAIQPAAAAFDQVEFGSFHALVIGNGSFASWPALPTAQADAQAVADLLARQYGFEVTLLQDADRYKMLSALNDYRVRLTEKDNFLIYYAGRCQVDEQAGRGYWLPVDAAPERPDSWISNVAITGILDTMSAKRVMVVADSCYSGTLTSAALTKLDPSSSEQARLAWLQTLATKRSRTALTSGALAPATASGGHSPFAQALIEALASNRDVLEGQGLFRALASKVAYGSAAPAAQRPSYAPIRFTGHEAGDFVFVPKI